MQHNFLIPGPDDLTEVEEASADNPQQPDVQSGDKKEEGEDSPSASTEADDNDGKDPGRNT